MAILVNMGQRGFVLQEGFVGPGQQVTVDQETAEKLTKMYPQELKMIVVDPVAKVVKQEPVVEEPKETIAEKPVVEPKKRGRKAKAK